MLRKIEKIDVLEYVGWLLALESMEKMSAVSAGDAVRVARALRALAPLSEQPEVIETLAREVCLLAMRDPRGRAARLDECREFLSAFETYLGRERCKDAVRLLTSVTRDKVAEQLTGIRAAEAQIEYRDANGNALYIPRRKRPIEELTLRLWDAHSALVESKSTKPYVAICATLNKLSIAGGDWSAQRVGSRLKPFKNRRAPTWRTSLWRFQFWRVRSLKKGISLERVLEELDSEEQPFIFTWH